MMVVGIAGGVLLAMKSALLAFLGALAFQILYLLDCVDGELARATNRFSPAGEPLDTITHYVTETALFAGTGIGLYLRTSEVFLLYAMLAAVITHLFHRISMDVLYQQFPQSQARLKEHAQSKKEHLLIRWLGFFSRPESLYIMLVLTLGFDLVFAPFPHPWGVTTFYYLGVTGLLIVKVFFRTKQFNMIIRKISTNESN